MANIKYRILAGSCPPKNDKPEPPQIGFLTWDRTDIYFDSTLITFDRTLE